MSERTEFDVALLAAQAEPDAPISAALDALGIPPHLPAGTVAAALRWAARRLAAYPGYSIDGLNNEQAEALRRLAP